MRSLGKKPQGARLERIKASARWAGDRFRNVHPIAPGLRDPNASMPTLSEFLCGGERRVPRGPLPSVNPLAGWAKPPASGLRATWLGHSTVLIEIDGLRVLTDPVWGPRASPSTLAGPKRFQPVPVALRAMPPLDLVIVSHDHYDHLDYPTIRELAKLDVPFVTSLGVGAHLEAWGVNPERITELDWWESHQLPNSGLAVAAAPSQHFSGRGLKDRNRTLWSSFIIRGERHAVFFSGDTGLTTEYRTIADRLGPFDLVMLEVGAFHPAWATFTWDHTTRSKRWDFSAAALSCQCTGARSALPCMPGTSPRKACWSWGRKRVRSFSCRASANRPSPSISKASSPGGGRSIPSRSHPSPPHSLHRTHCRPPCPGRSTSKH